jgi:pyruvate formate lyase activating enzyme
VLGVGEVGYCGLVSNKAGRLQVLSNTRRGTFSSYLDPHVTNCCAAWFCPAGTGEGYPKHAVRPGPEYGYYNLAIFFYACNMDCLFCQNAHHKALQHAEFHSAQDLVEQTLGNSRITCWCFFGGSPEPQLPFAISAAKRVLEELPEGRVMRICYEWNGCGNPQLTRRAAELALVSGGVVKFDLKAWSEGLSIGLSGVPNREAYRNFEAIATELCPQRRRPPLLTATTLLVPGYVDEEEVEAIAKFIASLDPEIPYSLLVFHPDHFMYDLPVTPAEQVARCHRAAKRHLRRVHIGNLGLIGLVSGL